MKKLCKILIFCIIFLLGISALYRVFKWKDTSGAYMSSTESFYAINDKDRIDVLFVGPSFCYHAMNPASLWEKTGIASFDMAISGQDKNSAYSYIREVLKTQTPQVVVVDYSEATYNGYGVQSNVYRNTLSMKLSAENARLIDSIVTDKKDIMSYLLRWPIVHTRYKELTQYDFEQYMPSIYSMGHRFEFDIFPWQMDEDVAVCEEITPISDANRKWVDDLKELAKNNNFELLFTLTPSALGMDNKKILNGFEQYLSEQGIPYINFDKLPDKAGIDSELHFIDHGHMNQNGSEQVMRYLAEYLPEHYALTDHRGDADYAFWDQAVNYQKHILAAEKFKNPVNVNYLADVASELDDLTIVLSLEGQFMNASVDVISLLDALQISAEDMEQGGTWIIDNGVLTARIPAGMVDGYHQKLNDSLLLSVNRKVNTENVVALEVSVGQLTYQPLSVNQYGVYFMVYDKMADQTLVNKWFW